ncbi:MAG: cytochrome ubiquinol oxidase subunit I, partial [Nitrospirota bacterium]
MDKLGISRRSKGRVYILLAILAVSLFLSLGSMALAEEAAAKQEVVYRDIPLLGSRGIIWVVAQIHLLLAGFVLGVPIFGLVCEIIGIKTGDKRYDNLAKEFTKLLTASFATTAMFGGVLLFSLITFYPKFFNYMTNVFWPTYIVYALLFVFETISLYLYWYGWDVMMNKKWLHITLGVCLNLAGFLIMIVSNAWVTFMASPILMPEATPLLTKTWAAVNNPTWWPVNIHRIIGNIVFGGYVCGAYAAVRYLSAKTQEEKAHYDWMGYTGNFIGTFGLLTLPFAGYYLMREVYAFNQQMAITLMGGILSWLFILQAIQIGVMFIGVNYYFWQGLAYRVEGTQTYKKYIIAMLTVLALCFLVWLTPHSLVASIEEARKMGGTFHPLLGVFGVMSAKLTVVNIMILTTFGSFLMYWRAGKQMTAPWAKFATWAQIALFFLAAIFIIYLGIYGYYVPAIYRVNVLSVLQVLSVLAILLLVTPLTGLMLKSARETTAMKWGVMPNSSQYVLISNGMWIVLTMTLMGYVRSSSRTY